jgi:hypothetical protein
LVIVTRKSRWISEQEPETIKSQIRNPSKKRATSLISFAKVQDKSGCCLNLVISSCDGTHWRILKLQDAYGGFTSEVDVEPQSSR